MSHRTPIARQLRRLPRSRIAPLALAVNAVLAAGLAGAVPLPIGTWPSDGYAVFAQNCPRAGGTGSCNFLTAWGDPNGTRPVLAWGPYEPSPRRNSYADWQNQEGYLMKIKSVQLEASDGVGTTLAQNGGRQSPGVGITGAWELNQVGADARIVDARMQISSGADPDALTTWLPAAGAQLASKPAGWIPDQWINSATGATAQTPINAVITPTTDQFVTMGDTVRLQVFQFGGAPEVPSAVLGSVNITFDIATANLVAAPTLFVARVGGTAVEQTVAVTNFAATTADEVPAAGVQAGAPTPVIGSGFSAVTLPGPTDLAANQHIDPVYAFTASGPGTSTTPVTSTATVNIGSTDAPPASFTLTGLSVGPVAQAAYEGGSAPVLGNVYHGAEVPGIDIDFGTVDIGQTAIRALTLSNIFGTDYGVDTDLTLNMTWGNGFELHDLLGNLIPMNTNLPVIAAKNKGDFNIWFRPTAGGSYNQSLMIRTDVGRAQGVGTGTLTDGSTYFKFDLMGVGAQAPLPGTLALFGLGLAGLAWRRRSAP